MRRSSLLVVALLVLGACASRSVRTARKMEGRYLTGSPRSDGWQKVSPGGADRAWWNPALGATIYTDSNCGARFEDGKLSSLADHLFFGLTSAEVLMKETFNLNGRDAVLSVARGRLDGVWVQVGAVVLNKDACTYDLLYVSSPERYAEGDPDFRAVFLGFRQEDGK